MSTCIFIKNIINIIYEEFSDREEEWTVLETSHLTNDLNLDSMDIVRLQVALEDYYAIRFEPETTDFEQVFSTPETLARHIQIKIAS